MSSALKVGKEIKTKKPARGRVDLFRDDGKMVVMEGFDPPASTMSR